MLLYLQCAGSCNNSVYLTVYTMVMQYFCCKVKFIVITKDHPLTYRLYKQSLCVGLQMKYAIAQHNFATHHFTDKTRYKIEMLQMRLTLAYQIFNERVNYKGNSPSQRILLIVVISREKVRNLAYILPVTDSEKNI